MTKEDMLHIANRCGFHFHDAGYAPVLHTTEAKYSQKCFERFTREIAEYCSSICEERSSPRGDYEADECASAIREKFNSFERG